MQHVEALKSHPHRDWILGGLGAATLLGVYACYKCCFSRKQKKVEEVPKATHSVKSFTATEAKKESQDKESSEPQNDSKESKPAAQGCRPCDQIVSLCGSSGRSKTATPSGKEENKAQTATSSAKLQEGEKGKDAKQQNDGNKYLPQTVHPPSNLVCPPARQGISLFMDSRPVSIHSPTSSNVRTYQRDRWYRGSSYVIPLASQAFLRASSYPLKVPARPGKMLKKINNGFQ